jgi:type IV pilus assembly protein PilM
MFPMRAISALLQDPAPALAFEVSEAGVAAAATAAKAIQFHPLPAGAISVSPVRDNILLADQFAAVVRGAVPTNGNRKRRDAVLILPDYCTRLAVLDFDSFPTDPRQQQPLIRFRMKKSIPFDIESAAVSYWAQPSSGKKVEVVVAVAPFEVISRYEAPFRAAGVNPGFVTASCIAMLNLVDSTGVTVIAKLSGRTLTVMVPQNGALKLIRCLELSGQTLEEIAADLYPTFVYVEDNLDAKADELLLCGFGNQAEAAASQFRRELGVEVTAMSSAFGTPGEHNAGLLGFLQSTTR